MAAVAAATSGSQYEFEAITAVIVGGMMAHGKVFGANSRIGVCTIGFNGQGRSHINDILKLKDDAQYVALCDVDSEVREKGAKLVTDAQGKALKGTGYEISYLVRAVNMTCTTQSPKPNVNSIIVTPCP